MHDAAYTMSDRNISVALPNKKAWELINKALYCEKSLDLDATIPNSDLQLCTLTLQEIQARLADTLSITHLFACYHVQKQLLRNKHFALTHVLYEEPLAFASKLQQELYADRQRTLKERPLLGCILSVKDSVAYKGTFSTSGFIKGFQEPYKETAGLITYLESKGALVTCKGNVPQALMTFESDNNIFGNTSNPHNEERTAGGSSGGEGALLASNCVNCAVGSDIAGSLRFPALFCGIYSLKPTAGRYADVEPNMARQWPNFRSSGDTQFIIRPTIGPMARSAADIEVLARVMAAYHEVDLKLPPLPWRSVECPTRIGMIRSFPAVMEPCTATARALDQAAACLGSTSGVQLIDIDITDLVEELFVNAASGFFKDEQLVRVAKGKQRLGEPLIDGFSEFSRLFSIPAFLLRKLGSLLASPREQLYIRALLQSIDCGTAAMETRQDELQQEVIRRFKEAGVEVALAIGVFPAIRKHTAKSCDFLCFHCFIWNYLNFPVGAVPVTRVRPDEQQYTSAHVDKITETLKFNMQGSAGLPVGVQVVGLPWHEEAVVEVMKKLEPHMDSMDWRFSR
ncbi:hypothetical protein CEUSTIGMA_g7718.t1 [Chlamydomonas eustigma]|uniref:Amidase domain-containing protein n=1 Tax=Chlamydomonas eustigma TaxID=1157962 RepID=A0A250XBY8_9CHLO|nr:hypothetical protein CEUSTIGMA_g7718.t1 [Chlamydomonas eustigma]|eukprot:GAX80280.1 hypothetical protein CEUSTIGMA_g7718.t1 [Chlamydomonas eustigma]